MPRRSASATEPGRLVGAIKEAAKGSDTIDRKRQHPDPSDRYSHRPVESAGVPMDIAMGILFLASDDAGYVKGAGVISMAA